MSINKALNSTGLQRITFKSVKTFRKNRREGLLIDLDVNSKKLGYSISNGKPKQISIHNYKNKTELKRAFNIIVKSLNDNSVNNKSVLKNDTTALIFIF